MSQASNARSDLPQEVQKYVNLSQKAVPVKFKGANSAYNKPPLRSKSNKPALPQQRGPVYKGVPMDAMGPPPVYRGPGEAKGVGNQYVN